MRKSLTVLAVSLAIALTGCGTLKPVVNSTPDGKGSGLRRIISAVFTRASVTDLQFEGAAGISYDAADVIAGAVSTRNPELGAALKFAVAARLIETSGPRVLEITLVGETAPRLFVCRAAMASECALILPSKAVRVYAQPIGLGQYSAWIVSRISKL